MTRLLLFTLIALTLFSAACGTDRGEEKHSDRNTEPLHEPITGPLTELVKSLVSDKWADDCDLNEAQMRLEIAQALDANADAISAAGKKGTGQNRAMIRLGTLSLRDTSGAKAETIGWQLEHDSWRDLYSYFQRIKDEDPKNASWQPLNRAARAFLLDDRNRMIGELAYNLDHASENRLIGLLGLLKFCEPTNCETISLNTDEIAFIQSSYAFEHYYNKWKQSHTPEALQDFIDSLKHNYDFTYGFEKNENVLRVSRDRFVLRLNAGDLAGEEAALGQFITSVWNNKSFKVDVQWVDLNSFPTVSKFIVGEGFGGRPSTNNVKKYVRMFSGSLTSAIPHEIGHVLGFQDRYFTTFDRKTCKYTEEYNEDDLMSNSSTGEVTPEMWRKLDEQYPFVDASRKFDPATGRRL